MEKTKELVKMLFKNDKGEPFVLTDGQVEIFDIIFKKKYPRNHIETFTRYGKSETVSMAVLARASTYPEKWVIAAGNKDKAGIIMGDVIKHIFDSEYTKAKFVIGKGESEENIRRYRNKDRINFNVGNGLLGEIFITVASSAMGFGAPNVVEDEAALISEKDHAFVMRMLGDQPENFLCKIGNPWESDHFLKSFENPKYHKVVVDYYQGIKEGRLKPEYVEEMRKEPFFDVLYECKRPPIGTADEEGWVSLLTRDEVDGAFTDKYEPFGVNKIGVDVAGGGRNFSAIVQRHTNVARIREKNKDPDTMNLAEKVMTIQASENIMPGGISTDSIGVGKGVYDLLRRQKDTAAIRGVNAGEKPIGDQEQEEFVNLRAQMFWKARDWILKGGKLLRNDDWFELTKIKYRTKLEGTRGKMVIMPKEKMLKQGVESPDVADAFAMTFVSRDIFSIEQRTYEQRQDIQEERRGQEEDFNPFNPFG